MVKVKIEKTKKTKLSKEKKKLLTYLFLILFIPLILGGVYFWHQVTPFNSPGAKVNVDIKSGMGVGQIAQELEDKGVIGSRHAFGLYVRFNNPGIFRTGRYEMRINLGDKKAVEILEKGPKYDYFPLTIQPGIRIADIKGAVNRTEKISGDQFVAALNQQTSPSPFAPANVSTYEGLLQPETFYFSDNDTPESAAKRFVQAQTDSARSLDIESKAESLGITPYQAYIIASLIERETRTPKDRPLVASVIYNRIKAGMPLQIDATLLYAKGVSTGSLTNSDKTINSPYNTYLNKGIPPTPISTFSKDALEAALNPETSDYYYYVLTNAKTGEHKFSKTLTEHEAAAADARARGVF